MRFHVIGAGAIGGLTGAFLTKHGEDLRFVDIAPKHVAKMNETGLFVDGVAGEFRVSAPASLPDQVNHLNRAGYRVTFIVSDSWTLLQWIGALTLLVCTLGIYSKAPGLLVVGERIESVSSHRSGGIQPASVTAPPVRQLSVGSA